MRVLLTGATGFIGSHVARLALAAGHEVIALGRPSSSLHRLADVKDHLHLVEGDLREAAALETRLSAANPNLCLHLAWYAEPGGKCLWAHENLDCLTGSLAFIRVLHALGCPRLVIAGTSVEYDISTGYVSETSPIRPQNLYAASKQALFLTASNFDVSGWSMATARIFSVYGPWEDSRRLVPYVVSKLIAGKPCELTRGEQIRDYSHVEDAAGAVWAIAKSSVVGPVNVASSKPVSVASIAERIGDIVGRRDLLHFGARPSPPGDPAFLVANTERLRDEVGWEPHYDLDSGLAHTIRWWRAQSRSPER